MHACTVYQACMLHAQRTLQRDVNNEEAVRSMRLALVRHAHQAQHPRHIAEQLWHLDAHTEGVGLAVQGTDFSHLQQGVVAAVESMPLIAHMCVMSKTGLLEVKLSCCLQRPTMPELRMPVDNCTVPSATAQVTVYCSTAYLARPFFDRYSIPSPTSAFWKRASSIREVWRTSACLCLCGHRKRACSSRPGGAAAASKASSPGRSSRSSSYACMYSSRLELKILHCRTPTSPN